MLCHARHLRLAITLLCLFSAGSACSRSGSAPSTPPTRTGEDANVTQLGSIEVTARLVEIPEGAIFERDLYNYATVLKYAVTAVHRGQLSEKTIYVGQYNPFKPRSRAADQHVAGIGGDLEAFRAGQLHRMALESSIDDHFMGGIVNKYFGQYDGPILWAVWTNLAGE